MWNYTDKVREHFANPRNVGKMENPDAVGEVGSMACGDMLRLFLKIDKDDRITDATFQTFGCASAIASSSALTELILGMTLDQALEVTNKDIAGFLGGLPRQKMHCSVMGREALEAAIKSYRGETVGDGHLEGEVVCHCFGVTDLQIKRAIQENDLKTVEDITYHTKAGGGCGECADDLEAILRETRAEMESKTCTAQAEPKKLTNVQRMQRIMKVLDEEIRPALNQDNGDVELIDIEGDTVYVSFRGACVNCPASGITLKEVVEKRLRETVEPDIKVEEAGS
jgi:NifU-like protein